MLKVLLWMLMGQQCPGGGECVPIHPPCDLGVALQTLTVASVPGNLSRIKLGVGENVNLSIVPTPPPHCPVYWGLTPAGAGSLSLLQGPNTTFTAHYRASTPTVVAYVGGFPFSVTYNVVEPSTMTAVTQGQPYAFPAGVQGAGSDIMLTIHPTDVSFAHLEVCELPSLGVNVLGYFQDFPPSEYDHEPAPCWSSVFPQNERPDAMRLSGWPSPWRFGGFDWSIPTRWRIEGLPISEAGIPGNVLQRFRILDTLGTTLVTKAGASVSRTP